MAQARQHSAVSMAAPPRRAGEARFRWPLLLCGLAGAVLVLDALFLMAQGVFMLGVTLPFAIGCGLLALSRCWDRLQHWLDGGVRRRQAWRAGVTLALVWLCSVAVFWTFLAFTLRPDAGGAAAPAAIVVLGSGTPNGTASPVLAARLDTALAQAARFPRALVVVSGGIDFDEELSEGQVMGDYLRGRGLAATRIVQEEKSRSTEENLLLSRPLLHARGIHEDAPVQLVTSDFHTVRAGWIAARAGYTNITAVGAPTPLYVRYNAWLREYFAVISGFLLREY